MPGYHVPPERPAPGIGGRPFEEASLVSSTSPPASTTPDATCTPASSLSGPQLQQRRHEQLRHALEHTSPSREEVSAVASAVYVQKLMELIDQHTAVVKQVTDKIDTLRELREARYAECCKTAEQRELELRQQLNERSDLLLQVQEERERSTRLLHENTVLHAHEAEQQEQLWKVVELCRARGQRLRALMNKNSRVSMNNLHRRVSVDVGASASPETVCELSALLGAQDAEKDPQLHRTLACSKGSTVSTSPDACTTMPAFASPPSSMSIHKAVATSASSRRAGFSPSPVALGEIAEDAEMAALLNVPYKLQVPSTPFGSVVHTITANAASTAHLLALQEEVNMLKQQLEEQRITYEQDRGTRTREGDDMHRHHLEKEAKYCATIEHLELLHEESLRELVRYHHNAEKELRDVRGQVEWLRAALQQALDLAEKERRRQNNEVYSTEQRMLRQYNPKIQSLHAELAECQRRAVSQAEKSASTIAQRDALIAELRKKLKAEANQRRRIEERYKLEMKGVHSELDLMRQSLRQMERRVYYRDVRDQNSEEEQQERVWQHD